MNFHTHWISRGIVLLTLLVVFANSAQAQSPVFDRRDDLVLGLDGINQLQAGFIRSAAAADFDNDGDVDLFLGGLTPGSNAEGIGTGYLLVNKLMVDGIPNTLSFQRMALGSAAVADSFGFGAVVWGDYDNDGDPDLFVAHEPSACPDASPINRRAYFLYENDSTPDSPSFQEVAIAMGVVAPTNTFSRYCPTDSLFHIDSYEAFGEGAVWMDYDNDGWLDLFVSNGTASQAPGSKDALFHNDGGTGFTNVIDLPEYAALTAAQNVRSFGPSAADFDRDGDIDLYLDLRADFTLARTIHDSELTGQESA